MRTKEFDVHFNGTRLTIVRLKDGAIIVKTEIPADATTAVAAVLRGESQTSQVSLTETGKKKKPRSGQTTAKKDRRDESL